MTADQLSARLVALTCPALGCSARYARLRVQDFLAALTASAAPGAYYPLPTGAVYVAVAA